MRLRLDRGGQRADRGAAVGEDARGRRDRRRGVGEVSSSSPRSGEGWGALPDVRTRGHSSSDALRRRFCRAPKRHAPEQSCRGIQGVKIMQRTTPPFRADHVGSLLRTAPLKEARDQARQGRDQGRGAAARSKTARSRRSSRSRRRSGSSSRPTASSAARGGTSTSSRASTASKIYSTPARASSSPASRPRPRAIAHRRQGRLLRPSA